MRKSLLPFLLLLTAATSPADLQRWKAEAQRVTITRDDWGIAHVVGPTDADAVFGMIYAQAEDDFPRIEANYLFALGRTAEAEGEKAIWQDLRARLYVSPEKLQAEYAQSPDWLKKLMNAWADGLNYYLATHPEVHPRALTRFEPWMALSFTEGSIGGDIERIDLKGLEKFYSTPRHAGLDSVSMNTALEGSLEPSSWALKQVQGDRLPNAYADYEPRGSNGIAIAPKITAPGTGALLLINPHTSFFFRSEVHMKSGEGLNAYGAATWGQFFIYQGFNPHAGWMHTSSGVDVVDEFAETVERRGGKLMYEYGSEWRPVQEQRVSIRYRQPDGTLGTRAFTTYGTHHGPIIRNEDGKWVAFAMMDKPILALEQSYLRTKASDLASYLKVAERKANSSNNTLFADDHGEIAYLHPQFVPRRDDRFDYTKPVDGSDPATDWHGLHAVSELPNVLSPPNGWVDNNNNWPWSSAGAYSPKAADFPKYMDMWGENPRGIHAVEMLSGSKGWTLDKLQAAAFDTRQPGFERLVPMLVRAWDSLRSGDAQKTRLAGPIAALRGWDGRWSAASIPNTLGNFWGAQLWRRVTSPEWDDGLTVYARLEKVEPRDMLADLDTAVARLTEDFGTWKTPWGEINRFQRISAAIDHPFSDSKPSIPVPFSSARWGSLASFGAGPNPGTKKWYGTNGNSFVAVVEFGPRVNARAITAGGESGHPQSPHFNDEAVRYASGALRQVYFWPDQLIGHTEQVYRPGAPLTRQARP